VNIASIEYFIIVLFVFTLGSIIGSLLNVCIYRLPREEEFWLAFKSLLYPPSHCPRCKRQIPFYDNVPIFGWLLLRGRCRGCQGRISARYPLIELLTALLFVAVYCAEIPDWWALPRASSIYHIYGPEAAGEWLTPLALAHWRYAFHMVLVVALIVATFIDIDLRVIPDTVTLPAMAVGILGNTLIGPGLVYLVPVWYQTQGMQSTLPLEVQRFVLSLSPPPALPAWFAEWMHYVGVPMWMKAHPLAHGLAVAVAGILVGGGTIWGVRIAGYWGLKKEAMGFGDVVLLAMIGSYIGWQGSLGVFFFAPLCALVAVLISLLFRFEREIPYGPYLSVATLIVLLCGRWVWPSVESILALGPFLPVAGLIMFASLIGLLYLTRTIMKLLGLRVDELEPEWEWTSADQLAHYANERIDDRQVLWPQDGWQGARSGRGLGQQHAWQNGPSTGHAGCWRNLQR